MLYADIGLNWIGMLSSMKSAAELCIVVFMTTKLLNVLYFGRVFTSRYHCMLKKQVTNAVTAV